MLNQKHWQQRKIELFNAHYTIHSNYPSGEEEQILKETLVDEICREKKLTRLEAKEFVNSLI